MHRVAVLLAALSIAASACSPGVRTEIQTNNGGTLDCRADKIEYFHFEYMSDARGAETTIDALITLTPDTGRPPGTALIEYERTDSATLVFVDDEDNRLGRASLIRLTNGWVVDWTERCD